MADMKSKEEYEKWKADRAGKASGAAVRASLQADLSEEASKAEGVIKQAWIAGLVIGVLMLAATLATIRGHWLEDNAINKIFAVSTTLVLSLGVYRKDKTSAILLLLDSLSVVGSIALKGQSSENVIGLALGAMYVIFAIQGVRGTFAYHKAYGSDGFSPVIGTIFKTGAIAFVVSLVYIVLVYGRSFGILPVDLSSFLARAPQKIAAADWKVFTSPEGQFSVTMPGSPERKTKAAAEGGVKANSYQYAVETGRRRFVANFVEFPDGMGQEPVEKILNDARDYHVQNLKGKLASEKSLYLNEFPGREMLVDTDDFSVRIRTFLIKNRQVYTLVAAVPKGQAYSEDANRFIDSFKLSMDGPQAISDRPPVAPVAPDWPDFSPEGGRFSVKLPGVPTPQNETLQTSAGPMTIHYFTYSVNINQSYSVQYADYPEALLRKAVSVDEVLRNACEGGKDVLKGNLVSEKTLTLDRYRGKEIQLENSESMMKIRAYLVDKRLYKMTALKPRTLAASTDDDKFLNSFQAKP